MQPATAEAAVTAGLAS